MEAGYDATEEVGTVLALLLEKQAGLFEVCNLRAVMAVLADYVASSGCELSIRTVSSLQAIEGRFPEDDFVPTRTYAVNHANEALLLSLLQKTIAEIV